MPRQARARTAKMANASRRNIKRAQLSRIGIREPRSIGRMTRSRARYSRPAGRARPIRRR